MAQSYMHLNEADKALTFEVPKDEAAGLVQRTGSLLCSANGIGMQVNNAQTNYVYAYDGILDQSATQQEVPLHHAGTHANRM